MNLTRETRYIGLHLTLWDSKAEPPEYAGLIYRWNGFAETHSVHSLLSYVETHGERLRRTYIAWIHELGENVINGKRLIDHLAFADGLSYWWMTRLVEQSHYKSPSITDAIRLLALEEILAQQRPQKLRLVSADKRLHETVRALCRRLDIGYEWDKQPLERCFPIDLIGVYRRLPKPAQALIALLRQCVERWPLRRAEKSGWFADSHSLFFCSYFFNIVPEPAREGRFHSRYWEGLHRLMQKMGLHGNWLQRYVRHDTIPDPETATKWIRSFNKDPQKEGFHAFLDGYLSWRIVLRVLERWLWLNFISWRLLAVKNVFQPQGKHLSLWPLMKGDWFESLRGPEAINNLLEIELFDAALRALPHQRRGLYLCENQSWERALIHAWRRHGHGQLIAVVHSTVRFWDLRYFKDPRTITAPAPHPLPQADLVALNGKEALDAYLRVDYPREAIVECEALRYGYINDLLLQHVTKKDKGTAISVLVLGDYVPSGTIKMLQLLEAAAPLMSEPAVYAVKPHPNFFVNAEDYPSLNLKVIMDPLAEILQEYDIAYSCNKTSAAVDSYLAGLPVVVMLEETSLNFSPLRGKPGVHFVSAPGELAQALQSPGRGMTKRPEVDEFFFLDPELPRWQRLLSFVALA